MTTLDDLRALGYTVAPAHGYLVALESARELHARKLAAYEQAYAEWTAADPAERGPEPAAPTWEEPPPGPTVYHVAGFGVAIYVRDDDAAALAALATPEAHIERKFQHEQPEASSARWALEGKGYDVVRPDPVQDVFDVNDPIGNTVVAANKTPAELPPLAASLPRIASS